MTPQEIARSIDHTLLKPEAVSEDIRRLCAEAKEFGFYAVCVNSRFVSLCTQELRGTNVRIASVVGFPLGAMDTSAKAFETQRAVALGATEIDMVLSVGALKERNIKDVSTDLRVVIHAAGAVPVKVILETHLLSEEEKILACELSSDCGAAFVKTSTGFTGGGATLEDVRLMKRAAGAKVLVKASGGIRSLEQAKAMIEAGASRLGTSSGVAILKGMTAHGGY